MKSLEKVQFFQNGINVEGFTELFKSFGENENLKHIKINDNCIKKSIDILIESLKNIKYLEELDISDSLIGSKNSVKLFNALFKNCQNLRELYANYNEIEKEEAQEEIFEIVKEMKNLKKFEIKGNEIDIDVHNNFMKSLPENFNVQDFEFEAYSEDELEIEEMEKVEKITKKISEISLNK